MSPLLTLPAELTIYNVAEARSSWLERLAEPGDGTLQVQADAVVEVDAAGLQLLVALERSLAGRQRRLELVDPSPRLREACLQMGLHALLSAEVAA